MVFTPTVTSWFTQIVFPGCGRAVIILTWFSSTHRHSQTPEKKAGCSTCRKITVPCCIWRCHVWERMDCSFFQRTSGRLNLMKHWPSNISVIISARKVYHGISDNHHGFISAGRWDIKRINGGKKQVSTGLHYWEFFQYRCNKLPMAWYHDIISIHYRSA